MSNTTAFDVDQLLKEYKIPIHGVSIGKVADKSTWRVDFHETATDSQRAMAMQLIINFDPSTVAPKKSPLEVLAQAIETLTKRLDKLETK
jgi:ubiquinone biosynthesis protein UbiJ